MNQSEFDDDDLVDPGSLWHSVILVACIVAAVVVSVIVRAMA